MRTIKKFFVVLVTLFLVAVLSGCTAAATSPDPKASSAADTKPSPSPKADPMVAKLGTVFTYTDGVSISVSVPTPFTPSAEAAGPQQGQQAVQVLVVVTNNSKKTLDLNAFPTATSGGLQANGIMDVGQNVGLSPAEPLLVGQTLKWVEAFSAADPKDLTISIAPSFAYQNAIFTSK